MTPTHVTSGDIRAPYQTGVLFGHHKAETVLLDALASGRMHHAWLFHGPEGIGKATLAYRLARSLFATAPGQESDGADPSFFGQEDKESIDRGLAVSSEHPVFKRIAAGGQADLCVVRSDDPSEKRQEIHIDDIRRMIRFFGLSAAQEGWRIVIIDGADRLNVNAANALLKILEEPPPQSLLILTAQTSSLLPATIRSRCRRLPLYSLDQSDFKDALRYSVLDDSAQKWTELDFDLLYTLSEGSPGKALRYVLNDGLTIHHQLTEMLENHWDDDAIHHLAEQIGGKKNAFGLMTVHKILSRWLREKINHLAQQKSPLLSHWMNAYEELEDLFSDSHRLDLNMNHVILNGLLIMKKFSQHQLSTTG